jgi:CRP-like cAMP-binding protein/rhodanese-related sulfurtransferase
MELKSSDLRKYKYFSTLSEEALGMLSAKLSVMDFPAKTEVIKEGTPGDFFYFIKSGRLEVSKTTKNGQEAKLAIITSGQGFGEMSLLTGSNRFCSVRTLTAATLYQLAKKDFEDIVGHETAFRNMLLKKAGEYSEYNKIKVLQPFALLEPDKMYAVLARMIEKTYGLGEDIIVQGEKGDYYYIIKSGRVAVLQKKKGEQETKQVAVLGEGDAFGEEALIRSDPRNATCRAIEETTVYTLDKVDFAQVMQTSFIDNIFVEDISTENYLDKFVLIDARVPKDYEGEHIKGAINIPMEVLRQKYGELDKSKSYITYCSINDSRGMTSAFLKNHGFNAKCLRGGVSSWAGPVVKADDGGQTAAQG